jgi:hypothetical protein
VLKVLAERAVPVFGIADREAWAHLGARRSAEAISIDAGVPPSMGRMLLAAIGSSTKSRNALRNRAPAKRAVTMRPFRDVVAVEAAMVV